ncbi:hypothetical protein F2Q70_00025228 [Brassica cretica]|uniref:Uncharacterized protein n=1 Tax=Brassica cretica TaxID=69181 RepID=A0A8S9LA18_BRACR|nr:hypothetical protein F2Q70_00025228 [Brassica cretica]
MATWRDSIGERISVVAKHRLLSLFLLSSPATKWRFLFFSVALLNQRRVSRWLMSTTENGVPSNGCSHRPRETGRCLSWLVSETKQNSDCQRIERWFDQEERSRLNLSISQTKPPTIVSKRALQSLVCYTGLWFVKYVAIFVDCKL